MNFKCERIIIDYKELRISFFRGGALQAVFFGMFFPDIFSGSGQNSKVCDVYIQNIRLGKTDVLNIHITYF